MGRWRALANGDIAALVAPVSGKVNKVVSTMTSVAAGSAFVTVVEVTPASAITIVGYSADFASILAVNYRLRIITGTDAAPTVLHQEVVATTANAWMPVKVDIPAGTRVAVQVVHGEVAAQATQGTINYEE